LIKFNVAALAGEEGREERKKTGRRGPAGPDAMRYLE